MTQPSSRKHTPSSRQQFRSVYTTRRWARMVTELTPYRGEAVTYGLVRMVVVTEPENPRFREIFYSHIALRKWLGVAVLTFHVELHHGWWQKLPHTRRLYSIVRHPRLPGVLG